VKDAKPGGRSSEIEAETVERKAAVEVEQIQGWPAPHEQTVLP
jgi:hypothetical protein